MAILGTMGCAVSIKVNQSAFVDFRDYPGGPGAYWVEQFAITYRVVGTAAYVINTWLQDGLLVSDLSTLVNNMC